MAQFKEWASAQAGMPFMWKLTLIKWDSIRDQNLMKEQVNLLSCTLMFGMPNTIELESLESTTHKESMFTITHKTNRLANSGLLNSHLTQHTRVLLWCGPQQAQILMLDTQWRSKHFQLPSSIAIWWDGVTTSFTQRPDGTLRKAMLTTFCGKENLQRRFPMIELS